ncbi:tagaturonate reductase [Fodinibius sediminis]|uniref:Tagaturonate reductase n=1 Tax=Fodinibius sediminis TaxID=1214077 RepID=A0A521EB84_9BACT|nr:tagaturonate reductase [Fodinibius sediminis]SMO80420.1 tagaturonate reductase [Fodinibius sediminis]
MEQALNRTTAGTGEAPPVKILQFGEGNFLRAFVDWMIDILNEQTSFSGAIEVIQPIPHGRVDTLNQQEGLYHVLLEGIRKGKPHAERRLITSVKGGLNPYEDYKGYLQLAENPGLEFIVSNTTEAGIAFDNTDTSADTIPNSFPGKLTALLYHRFTHFQGAPSKAPVIVPCELIDRNGDKLKQYVLQYADLWDTDPAFHSWIKQHCIFCNTLVDRIVPGYPEEKADSIQKEMGYNDQLIVAGEYFHLWVIEGPSHIQKQLPFQEAGLNVLFVDDLTPYRTRKVRILNGLHTSMVPVGYLNGNRTVKQAVDDEVLGPFLEKELFEEIIPTLDLPEEELSDFAHDILDRFRNPFIKHELSAIALNSISKYKVRVLPSLLKYHELHDTLPDRLVFALAAMICFYRGEWEGDKMPLNDSEEVIAFIQKAWRKKDIRDTVQMVLGNKSFWGQDLNDIQGLTQKITASVMEIQQNGITSTLQKAELWG